MKHNNEKQHWNTVKTQSNEKQQSYCNEETMKQTNEKEQLFNNHTTIVEQRKIMKNENDTTMKHNNEE